VYDTIVHPTDGSSCSKRALEHAISLAKQYDATLHVLYVVLDVPNPGPDRDAERVEELTEAGESILGAAEERARDAHLDQVSTHLRRGPAPERILELVEDRDADLVVMGTHGRSGVDRFLLGSTTERVLRRGSVPVPVLAVESLGRGE
jgi:nucleotide-binding universal stress UspA family protein